MSSVAFVNEEVVMKLRVALPLLAIVLLLDACNALNNTGSGKVITEQREVSGFDKVVIAGSGTAQITLGEKESLSIEAEDNVMPRIESRVENGVLTLSQKSGTNISLTKPIRYTVTMIDITGLEITGSGTINVDGLDASIVSLVISGSGDINISGFDGDSINANITGSGNIMLSGDVADQVVGISGSGKYRAADLHSGTAVVDVGGSGEADLWVDTTLDITIGGSGDVSYYGNPILTQSIGGSGSVEGLGAK
jgi:hypothetical protein